MRHGSLFSGIGGFELAAEWMGWENVFHCEWNPFGEKVIHHYWPNSISYQDITKTDFTKHYGQIDILTGGFPCQPYSAAGLRRGKEDSRHLWPEMLRAIREISPRFVVGENVRGLTNWNGGLVFDEVHADLEAEGYQVAAFIIPAAAVNAPHGRDRVWFVAHAVRECKGNDQGEKFGAPGEIWRGAEGFVLNPLRGYGTTTHAGNHVYRLQTERELEMDGALLDRRKWKEKTNGFEVIRPNESSSITNSRQLQRSKKRITNWKNFPTEPPVCGGDDGLPTELDGITFSKWRNESLKAYGNAIVPQVAFEIFKNL